jgi:hypothetical protein
MADKIYRRLKYAGIRVNIDRPVGFVQQGDGWTRVYKNDYGFIPRTDGGDDEDLDVFMANPPDEGADCAYLCVQGHRDGTFDEYKLILGARSSDEAVKIYADHIPLTLLQRIHEIPIGFLQGILGVKPTPVSGNELRDPQTLIPMVGITESLRIAAEARRFNTRQF